MKDTTEHVFPKGYCCLATSSSVQRNWESTGPKLLRANNPPSLTLYLFLPMPTTNCSTIIYRKNIPMDRPARRISMAIRAAIKDIIEHFNKKIQDKTIFRPACLRLSPVEWVRNPKYRQVRITMTVTNTVNKNTSSEFDLNKAGTAPAINNILPVCPERIFIGKKGNDQYGRHEQQHACIIWNRSPDIGKRKRITQADFARLFSEYYCL